MLKFTSISSIAQSLLTSASPEILSSITVKPLLHLVGAQPVLAIRVTWVVMKMLISSNSVNALYIPECMPDNEDKVPSRAFLQYF